MEALSEEEQKRSANAPMHLDEQDDLAVAAPAHDPRVHAGVGRMVSPYHMKLAKLAYELAMVARGTLDAMRLRLLRDRLTEWVEDVRSVGGHDALAGAVEELANRLAAALAGTAPIDSELTAIVNELSALAAGAPPPAPKKKSRSAFWK